jgi:hypothetical protein
MQVAYSPRDPFSRVARTAGSPARSTVDTLLDLSVETLRPNPRTMWLVFHGQADLATRATLQRRLDAAALEPPVRSLHLHLADLTFADVHAVTRLAAFAAGVRGPDTVVVTCRPSSLVRRIATILGVSPLLGLS